MMTNLFSSFDPSTNWNTSLNWSSSMIGLIVVPPMYWLIPSRNNILWVKVTKSLHKEFKNLLGSKTKGGTLLLISMFAMILMNNSMGLFPYVFTSTSHLSLSLSLALPLWISLMIHGWFKNTTHMLAHLVPQGTPPILMPFMVCIETISNLIRPLTLSIRLTANMIAGHLLLTLLGNTGNNMTLFTINLLIITQILLLILESAVSIIQSYVFAVLGTLYSSEIN